MLADLACLNLELDYPYLVRGKICDAVYFIHFIVSQFGDSRVEDVLERQPIRLLVAFTRYVRDAKRLRKDSLSLSCKGLHDEARGSADRLLVFVFVSNTIRMNCFPDSYLFVSFRMNCPIAILLSSSTRACTVNEKLYFKNCTYAEFQMYSSLERQ